MTFTQKQIDNKKPLRNEHYELYLLETCNNILRLIQKKIDNKITFRNKQSELNIPEMRDTIVRLIIDDKLTNQEIKKLKAELQILIDLIMLKKRGLNFILICNKALLSFITPHITKFSDRTIH